MLPLNHFTWLEDATKESKLTRITCQCGCLYRRLDVDGSARKVRSTGRLLQAAIGATGRWLAYMWQKVRAWPPVGCHVGVSPAVDAWPVGGHGLGGHLGDGVVGRLAIVWLWLDALRDVTTDCREKPRQSEIAERNQDNQRLQRETKTIRDCRQNKTIRDCRQNKTIRDCRQNKTIRDCRQDKTLRDCRPSLRWHCTLFHHEALLISY